MAKADAERLFNRIASHLGGGLSYLNLCWLHLISPTAGVRMLHEAIETVPANKIFAFGGDFIIPEGAYGHSVIARKVVTDVLAQKVMDSYLTEDEALNLARGVLRDNPAALYRLKLLIFA